jgi:hypothetical protein
MPLDTNIPLQAQAPQINPLQMALQAAQFRAYNANGLAAQQQLAANQATSRAFQASIDPTTGQLDTNKLSIALQKEPDAAFNYAQTMKSVQDARQAQQTYDKGAIDLNNSQRDNYANGLKFFTQQFATVDPKDPNAAGKIMQIGADAVTNGHIAPSVYKAMVNQMPDDPSQWQPFLKQKLASFQDAGAQLGSITPKPTQVDNGATKQYVDTNPISNPSIVGTTIQNQLSPESATAPVSVMGPGNTPGVVPRGEMWNGGVTGAGTPQINVPPLPTGANQQGAGQAAPMPGGGHFVPTGTPMGVADSNAGNVDTVNKHWATVGNDANNAQTNIGIAQNIKAYADKALTGKQSDKLAAVNGILSIFGQGGQTDISTATDLLQKNMARLSLTSRQGAGGTDAAGALATAANPHGTMTAEAIKDAADQVIGAQKMAIAQQQLLQPYKLSNDVAGYQTALSKFNQAADPRVWQFQGMDAQQRAKFKAGMSPADQKAFSNKIRTLEGIGAIQ